MALDTLPLEVKARLNRTIRAVEPCAIAGQHRRQGWQIVDKSFGNISI